MAVISRFSNRKNIPKISTKKSSPTTTNFAKGIYTYKPNDLMGYDEVDLAQNARFDRIGEYATRHGLVSLSEPIGLDTAVNTYGEIYEMSNLPTEKVEIYTLTDDVAAYSLTVKVSSNDDTYGVLGCDLVDEDDNILATSFINPDDISEEESDVEFVFNNAPTVAESTDISARFYAQGTSKKKFKIAMVGDDVMMKFKTATPGDIGNIFEANIDGIRSVLFTFRTSLGCSLYALEESGTVNLVRALDNDVENVRFNQNVNEVRYADGKNGPCKLTYDKTTNVWTPSDIGTLDLKTGEDLHIKVSNILDDTQDNLMYFDAETDTQAIWGYPYGFAFAKEADYVTSGSCPEYDEYATSQPTGTVNLSTLQPSTSSVTVDETVIVDNNGNYAKVTAFTSGASSCTVQAISHKAMAINTYDSFDRDFRQNFPAILTGDPLTAMFNLGGVVYVLTRKNKYYKYSQSADVWTQAASNAQNGTFTQESTVCDLNYAYYANDNGIYIFDGSSEASLTEKTIQNVYDAIKNKEQIKLDLYNNRLYCFYPSTADGPNDHCLVYNINLKLWESFDSGVYVNATNARRNSSNRFICGHSKLGLLMLAEEDTSPYSDLGAAIDFDLETSYQSFGTPSQLKRIENWRPEFSTTKNPYYIACGYALDFSENVRYAFSINLKDGTPVDTRYVWDNPSNYGVEVTPTILTTKPQVYGDFRRCQLRYQHHAAFEPVNFKSHTLTLQTQRIR